MATTSTRVAAVTGAAQGIGAAIATRLSAEGFTTVLIDRDESTLDNKLERIREDGRAAAGIPADLSRPEAITAAFDRIHAEHGRLDVLVNNAGVTRDIGLLDLSPDDWDWIFDINARGTFLCLQAGARLMQQGGGGAIVNIASIAGKGWTKTSNIAYAASKGAVVVMTRIAAADLARHDITVNAVCPGVTLTPLVESLVTNRGRERGQTADEALAELNSSIPLARANQPDDIAAAVQFLASPAARNITGQSLNVDGGLWWD
jgi:NAD(P)-dependent dehydrogenase (short-subunit alcohol dehydrogenase family)